MIGIGFIDDLISKIGVPLVAKGIKALTGIDIESKALTQEDKQKIMDNQIEIMKIDFEKIKEDNRAKEFVTIESNKNTNSARELDSKKQESPNATTLAKNAAYYIDFFVIASTMLLCFIILYAQIPESNIQIVNITFGAMLGYVGTIINFHRGTSQSSSDKQVEITRLTKG